MTLSRAFARGLKGWRGKLMAEGGRNDLWYLSSIDY